jgi:hypothetical protein
LPLDVMKKIKIKDLSLSSHHPHLSIVLEHTKCRLCLPAPPSVYL